MPLDVPPPPPIAMINYRIRGLLYFPRLAEIPETILTVASLRPCLSEGEP